MAVKKDCILYDQKNWDCKGLKKLYCRREETCAFYKKKETQGEKECKKE